MLGIFLDTEANGLNPFHHHPIEIAFKILDLQTGSLKETYEAVIHLTQAEWKKSDPSSLQVNGLSYEEVAKGKKSSTVAMEITNTLQRNKIERGSAVFICQNHSFDRVFFSQLIAPDIQEDLKWPYYWLDLASMYWAQAMVRGKENPSLLPWVTGFSKDRIASVYHLAGEQMPHRAMNGVNHLILCYEKVVGYSKS